MTVLTEDPASASMADTLSASGPLVTTTRAVSRPGNSSASPAAKACQKLPQVVQPLERNASKVVCGRSTTPTTTAPPLGVTPLTS